MTQAAPLLLPEAVKAMGLIIRSDTWPACHSALTLDLATRSAPLGFFSAPAAFAAAWECQS